MVPGNDYGLHMTVHLGQTAQERIIPALGRCRRIGTVEHIPGHQQGIRPVFFHPVQQPVQKNFVFPAPVIAEEILTQMPIGRM